MAEKWNLLGEWQYNKVWEAEQTQRLSDCFNLFSQINPGESQANKDGTDCILADEFKTILGDDLSCDNKMLRYSFSGQCELEILRNFNEYSQRQYTGRLFTDTAKYTTLLYNLNTDNPTMVIFNNKKARCAVMKWLKCNNRYEVEQKAREFQKVAKPKDEFNGMVARQACCNICLKLDTSVWSQLVNECCFIYLLGDTTIFTGDYKIYAQKNKDGVWERYE